MGKKANGKNKGSIIQFPGLKERLMEKGLDALKIKHFKEALALLKQAKELENNNPEIELGIVVCLLELGDLEHAKENCKRMLQEDVGDYFHVLQVYLTILIQLGQYNEVETTIEAVLEENQVPTNYIESFFKLLDLSKRMVNNHTEDQEEFYEKEDLQESLTRTLIELDDVKEQYNIVLSLKERNIHKYVGIFESFLKNSSKHAFIKTLVIQLLIDNKVNKEIEIEKFGARKTINPSLLPTHFEDDPVTKSILSKLDDKLGSNNPTLFEAAKEIWMKYKFGMFPFEQNQANSNVWAATLHLYAAELHGIVIENSELENEYETSLFELKYCLDRIQKIEEISFF